MKKDINFLQVKKQGEGKKGANTVVILAVVMVLIIGVMGYLFGSTKVKINDTKEHIAQLEIETQTGKFAKRDAEYQKVSTKLNNFLLDTIKVPEFQTNTSKLHELSLNLFDDIYSSRENEFGEIKINLRRFEFDSASGLIDLRCSVIKVGDQNIELLREVDNFIARLNEKSNIKEAIASSINLNKETGEIDFTTSITVQDKNISLEGE